MNKTLSNFLVGFLAGAAVGAIAGILFAPEKGSKTRQNLGKKVKDLDQEFGLGISDFLDDMGLETEPVAPVRKREKLPNAQFDPFLKINVMAEEISISELIKKLFDQIKAYYNLRVGYLRLYIAEYLIKFFSSLVLWMVIFLFLFFVLVFSSFAFAYWFGELTGRWSVGFLIIAGFYVLLAVLIFAFRRILIVRPFTQLIIKQMELDKFNDLEDEKGE